jgi:hypothetical protein
MAKTTKQTTTRTAADAYDARVNQIDALITTIRAGLDRHRKGFDATDRRHWGYVGDLARVAELLGEIDASLGNDDPETR